MMLKQDEIRQRRLKAAETADRLIVRICLIVLAGWLVWQAVKVFA